MAWYNIFQKTEPPKPPLPEIAINESALYKGFQFLPFNPDQLVHRKGLSIYTKMSHDEQIKSCLALKVKAVIAPGWEIEPASSDPQDIIIKEFTEFTLEDMHGSFSKALEQILNPTLRYGFSVTEKVWKVIKGGDHAGKIGLKALKAKDPQFFWFDQDDFGNLKPDGLVQSIIGELRPLPVSKFIIYVHQFEFQNWFGTSDLRAAYRAWWSKENLIKFWNIHLERYGSPLTLGLYKGSDPVQRANLENIIKNLQNTTSATYDPTDFEIKFLESVKKGTATYKEAIEFHDQAISRAILIPGRIKDGEDGGARAEAQVRFNTFLWIVQSLQLDLAESAIQEQLIKDIVNFNFSNVTKMPTFKFKASTNEEKRLIAKEFGDLVQKRAVRPTLKDENHIRESFEFPLREEDEEALDGPEVIKKPEVEAPKDPARQEPQPKEPDQEKQLMAQKQQKKTIQEERIDFVAIEKSLDGIEAKTIDNLQVSLTKQRDALTDLVIRKMKKNELNTQFINSIDLKFIPELRRTIKVMTNDGYDFGKIDASKQLPARFASFVQGQQGIAVQPTRALSYLESRTDFTVKGITDPLIRGTQASLLTTIQTGESIPEAVKRLQDLYIPYLSDGSVIIDKKQFEPFRLETIVRTNLSQSFNYGRRAIGEDPELQGFVIGYQFSEILDSRTVEVSIFINGKIISIKEPRLEQLTYPLHFNERGLFVFVTQDDPAPITFMSQGQIDRALNLKSIV